ncbi:Xre family transcriptional regulator [Paenibacillus sp. 32O-W]|uniref:helix-turn-helix domain-containing protein n=1 Tax=Paenibacillus sp. 32O-W TaxID=1695218 RepID=UPI00072004AA|nr:helix-turn-helix transcriptional regulator [Paenibacillus sp. 32O-W]ALS27154.1 Xre family transcriptional regulator [Paenibacillus sp. 32O-W]
MNFGQRLRKLRENKKITQKELSKILNVSESAIGMYERGEREPNFETVDKIANFFNVPTDYLLGRTDNPEPYAVTAEDLAKGRRAKVPVVMEEPYYALTKKDERDIARDLERMMSDLESNDAMAFYGEPMDEETRELIRLSLEHSMRLAKEMAKKKFTPKKYRKGEE